MTDLSDALLRGFHSANPFFPCGRVSSIGQGLIGVSGLTTHAQIGARVCLQTADHSRIEGEIVRMGSENVHILIGLDATGVSIGDRVLLLGLPELAPSDRWIGRVIDPLGQPIDGRPMLRGTETRKITNSPPPPAMRRGLGNRLSTGLSVLNTLLPVVRGQRVGLFAGSGVGKSRLLAHLAKRLEADVVVIALIGERGREVRDFVQDTLGEEGMKKSVVVAASSDQSALMRRNCALTAMTVAEHFRDQGKHVLFLADSVTRMAEAQREIAAVSGEDLSLRGFPASLTPLITGLCERAGPGGADQGDITAVFSVLVAGSDMEEPVADTLRGVLDGHVVLSRDIAERGRFPAIDVGRSVSRALPFAASDSENQILQMARRLLGSYENSEVMIRAGLYSEGSDPLVDQAVRAWPELDAFFASEGSDAIASDFDKLSLILRRAGAATPTAGPIG